AFMTMGQALMQALATNEFRGRVASMNMLVLGGVMSVMNLANGALGTVFPAAAILLVTGLLFVGVMLVSVAFTTPRRVYRNGMPSRRPVPAAAGWRRPSSGPPPRMGGAGGAYPAYCASRSSDAPSASRVMRPRNRLPLPRNRALRIEPASIAARAHGRY